MVRFLNILLVISHNKVVLLVHLQLRALKVYHAKGTDTSIDLYSCCCIIYCLLYELLSLSLFIMIPVYRTVIFG